ncbi:hypothetical protein HK104_004835, partial [Borealophlyctis nickersoniae]
MSVTSEQTALKEILEAIRDLKHEQNNLAKKVEETREELKRLQLRDGDVGSASASVIGVVKNAGKGTGNGGYILS